MKFQTSLNLCCVATFKQQHQQKMFDDAKVDEPKMGMASTHAPRCVLAIFQAATCQHPDN